jgi:hypothetical protein
VKIIVSTAASVAVTKSTEDFLVRVSELVGLALSIMEPAVFASEMRHSWIWWRSGIHW